MFWVTRYPMISKTESGRVSKEIPGSGSGSGTRWALHRGSSSRTLRDEALTTIQNGSAQSIISMSKVLSSVLSVHDRMWSIRCHRIPDKRRGRDSLHDYWTVDTCSATRREKINTVKKILLPNIDWSQYNLYFCCVDGDKNGSQVVHRTLADFNQMFTLRGSIAFMGKRRTFQGPRQKSRV